VFRLSSSGSVLDKKPHGLGFDPAHANIFTVVSRHQEMTQAVYVHCATLCSVYSSSSQLPVGMVVCMLPCSLVCFKNVCKLLFLFFCFCGILASFSEVSQRGGSTSTAQISSNWLVVRSWSYPVRESPWVLKVTDSSCGLFVGRSCVYTVDNDEPAEWIVLIDQVVESRD